jgi:hypothetical protein
LLTNEAYRLILQNTNGWNIARIWNIVPYINNNTNGLENYQAFCKGRSEAYHEHYKDSAAVNMPASTGIGRRGPFLDISFIACLLPVIHYENLEQVPAYMYPARYGPRPPSFARATICDTGNGRVGFVSGTASIKGHSSVHSSIEIECETTVDNLRIMGMTLENAGISMDVPKYINVFIRRPEQYAYIRDYLSRAWLGNNDIVKFHNADICRAELGLEIEYMAIESKG